MPSTGDVLDADPVSEQEAEKVRDRGAAMFRRHQAHAPGSLGAAGIGSYRSPGR
ncbi:hypothetical protein ACFXI8_27250 [Streptomyces niveus]|uniref:hypothetical protein n=1 Tax=Streptomyces niveus TaxID=193462 RepID=UPI0036D15315